MQKRSSIVLRALVVTLFILSTGIGPARASRSGPTLTEGADLSLGKADSPDPATVGSTLTYTLTVTNNGPESATGASVTDSLPASVSFVWATTGCSYTRSTHSVACDLGSIVPATSTSATIAVKPGTAETIINTATVVANEPDPDPGNNAASAGTTVDPSPPKGTSVEVAVADYFYKPKSVRIPQGYTVVWKNNGPSAHTATDSSGMTLFDSGSMPAGASYSHRFLAAGTYPYRSTNPEPTAMTGSVIVPLVVVPLTGAPDTEFAVTWAAEPPPSGYVSDVQVRYKPCSVTAACTWEAWTFWQRSQTSVVTSVFMPGKGAGTYAFRARLRNPAVAKSSLWSPARSIAVRDGCAPTASSSGPNVLLILTDDQRLADDSLSVMPDTRLWFRERGIDFTQGSVTTSLCCPSRASIFTGQYAHNHGVLANGSGTAVRRLDAEAATVQRYLCAAGYNTGLTGNFFPIWNNADPPSHFEKAALTGSYHVDGTYNTEFLGDNATRFLQDFEKEDSTPWFLYIGTKAPHADFTAEGRYADAPVPPWDGNPAVFETDRTDKPPWVQNRRFSYTSGLGVRRAQLRTLMSVDDLVGRLFRTLQQLDEDRDTLAFFTSDNGYMYGEHGLSAKRFPYSESIHVPFLMRWPARLGADQRDNRMVANVDIAPTVLDAAGIPQEQDRPMDGVSLLSPGGRNRQLLEYYKSGDDKRVPAYGSIRTDSYQYIEWRADDGSVSFREYYDLAADPWQLQNLLADGDATNDPDVVALSDQLAADRACRGSKGGNGCP